MDTAIVENGYIKVTKDGRFFRTYNGTECRLVKTKPKRYEYYYITYRRNGYQERKPAHRVYAEAFIPNHIGDEAVVLAKDNNLLNISDENLYWATNSDRLNRYYDNATDDFNNCSSCGVRTWKLEKGGLCSSCKQKVQTQQKAIKRKENRIAKYKEEFQHVDMDVITTREADMINMRINDCTLEEIGEKYSLTKEGVRQILNRVKKKF